MKLAGIAIFLILAIASLYYALSNSESPADYMKGIQQEREAKEVYMKSSADSPFVESKLEFQGLKYFPADLKYRIDATLVASSEKKIIMLPTSDGHEKTYLEFGHAEFELDGTKQKLLILEVTEAGPYRGTLYLAFADETSARETYGAGRYLDLKKVPGASSILLDFNKAYNPYCAYSDIFSCPFPPKENILTVAIRAGEKIYH